MNYKSLAVHNAACNWIFRKFQDCENKHPYGKFLGYCEYVQKEMNECIREQREIHRYESAQYRRGKLERQKKLYTENSD